MEENSSLIQTSDKLVSETAKLVKKARTEEDLRIGFEKLLAPLLEELGIKSNPRYERLGSQVAVAYKGRPDAVHGLVIIEYEKPDIFKSQQWVKHAHEQLVGYIIAEASQSKETLFIEDPKYIGVGFDGYSIFFTKYTGDRTNFKSELDPNDFAYDGPFILDLENARTLLTYLRSLARRPLTAEHLAESFGPQGDLAPQVVSAFADSLEYWGKERVKVFFNEWKRLFGIVYGEQFGEGRKEEAVILSNLYKVGEETDFQELLFSVHTYFALLMKLIVLELLSLKETAFNSSYSYKLTHASKDNLLGELRDIEDGGAYAKKGVTNFLEGDFFSWYLDAWSPRLEEAVREMTRRLSEFEPATSIINPETTRDLLKKLYQYLVPKEVRHRLGEYYTPDWLAELLLDEVNYIGDSRKRFLDPACGSGTFLVLAIRRIKEYSKKQKENPFEIAKRIESNIWGFDLNPLAVIAARTNYLFAMGDLTDKLQNIEIPIYLADSVLWPQRAGQISLYDVTGDYIGVQTSIKLFHVPKIWVDNKGFLMRNAAPLTEDMVKNNYKPEEALNRYRKNGLLFPPHDEIVKAFYEDILELERQGRNGIWARFLKNAFAPMVAAKFDFVVGNPPWIRWGYLSKEYRESTLPLWKNYGLFSLKGHAARLGGGEKDFSMLFTYASADYYLANDSKLGFLITQEVFKSKGAGEGFRRFQLGERKDSLYLKVLKALDLVTVQPFEGASNKTAAIILKKGEKTEYPVPYFVYSRKEGVGRISPNFLLKEAKLYLNKKELLAQPIGKETGSWQTLSSNMKHIARIEGNNTYKARRGASTDPYGVFWIDVKQVLSDGSLLINNLADRGKQKFDLIEEKIEPNLVFPSISGADIQRWGALPKNYLIVSQDPDKRVGYTEEKMKNSWPRTYGYLLKFKDELLNRAVYVKYHSESKNPFYSQYNIAYYTFSNYKVVWKRMASDLIGAVISQYKTPFGYKTLIPTDTTAFFSTNNEDEAYYLCAVVNSSSVREFIKSYSSAGRGFGAPSVMDNVGIPKFDSKNRLHSKLAEISKKCHQLIMEGAKIEVSKLEKENDKLVTELFNI